MKDPLFSLNALAFPLAEALIADAISLRIGVTQGPGGETLVDCGHRSPGSLEAGLRLARISMAGLSDVALVPSGLSPLPWSVLVRTSQPWLACLASQYAGWHLRSPDGSPLLGSGPARALSRHEPVFHDLPHEERADRAVLVLEGDVPPDETTAVVVAKACKLRPRALIILHAPTGSLAGMVQIAARVVECAVQKAHHLGFPVTDLAEAVASAPICPPHPDTRVAMGRANDAIIYGGRAQLFVTGAASQARDLAQSLPSQMCADWGRAFAEVWEAAEGDFARIDSRFFSPAEILVTALETGETYSSGCADSTKLLTFTQVGGP